MKLIIFESSGSSREILITNYSKEEMSTAYKNKVPLNAWSPIKAGKIKINKLDLQNNYIEFDWVPQKRTKKNSVQEREQERTR